MKGCCALGQVYSHLSEEERQVVRIEMGNGASVRRMAMMPGRHANRRRPSTKPTTGPCECSATAPPPRHSPTNCQNQPRTRMLHLQIDNGPQLT